MTERVAFFGFSSSPGGIGKVMANLINELTDMSLEVDVLLDSRHNPDAALLSPRVRIVELPSRSLASLPRLARYLKAERPAALLANKEWAIRQAVLARQLIRQPIRIAIRVGTNVQVQLQRRHLLKRWTRAQGIRYSYRLADGVIANSRGVAGSITAVTGIPLDSIHVLANPTVPPDLLQRSQAPVSHPWLDPGRELPLLLAVGRLSRPKDYPTLLRTLARLQERRPCRLVILGEGGERPALENLVRQLGLEQRVQLPGFDKNPYAWMAQANAFVLSSAWEGCPNVLIEALAVGCPVVATDCPFGPSEILAGGRHGPLVPVGDDAALAKAIIDTLERPLPKAQLQAAATPYQARQAALAYRNVLLGDHRS